LTSSFASIQLHDKLLVNHCGLPIADCQLGNPQMNSNRQLAIDNWQFV
jgi:hypothetical protein